VDVYYKFSQRTIINFEELADLRDFFSGEKIVFCSGTFDLLHLGQVYFLKKSKECGDLLVVSVGLDSVIKRNKDPKRPILNQDLRLRSIAELRCVDFCFLDDEPEDTHPLATLKTNLKNLRPNIYVVNHDAFDLDYRKKLLEGTSTKLEVLDTRVRFGGPNESLVSTTEIIKRIKAL